MRKNLSTPRSHCQKSGAAERVAADIAEGVAGRGSREGIKTVVMVDLVMDSAGVGDHIGAA